MQTTKTSSVILVVAGAVALLAACGSATAPQPRHVGIIEWVTTPEANRGPSASVDAASPDDPMSLPVLEAPPSVQAGEAFDVTVRTYANACWTADGAQVVTGGRSAVITPYDRGTAEGVFCPQIVVRLPRTVRLTFTERGTAVVRVSGRRVVVGDTVREDAAEFEVSVLVQ
jgi:hypothetical protein